MATGRMPPLGSVDLLMDDKWLSSILGEEEKLLDGDKGVRREKRQRKEKKIFDPSAIAEVTQQGKRRKRKEKDALLLRQSPYLIRQCFVNVERIETTNNIPAAELTTGVVSREERDNVNKDSRDKLFALSEEQKLVLETVSLIKQEESGLSRNIFPCPKCQRMFFSLNKLKLHIDSGHEYFQAKVRACCRKEQFSIKTTSQVRCLQCMKVLYGSGYEHHCLKYHENLLSLPEYKLSPIRLINIF